MKMKRIENRVKCAALPVMRECDAFDIKWGGSITLADSHDVDGRDKEKLGFAIDQSTNEPRAGYSVDLWAMSRQPESGLIDESGNGTCRNANCIDRVTPGIVSSLKVLGDDAVASQPRDKSLA